jgi:diguanylate cyclase (GGDEF)-like protein
MLDTASLRVSFALVAFTLLALFYLVTYRTSRSAYAAWWCVALAMFLSGASAYLLNGTEHQVWANPLGNVLVVTGAGCVWAGSRSLRNLALPSWCLVVAPAVVGAYSAVDDPADNVWAGGPFFLAAMWVQLGLAAGELWRLLRADRSADSPSRRSHRLSVGSLVVASGAVAVFYLGRWVAFLAVGPDASTFTTVFGGQVTTLVTTVLLATVSFSMSTMSDEQQKAALRELAVRDGLTGLLNRTEFLRLAEVQLRSGQPDAGGQLILADLDHFKSINDEHGHLAGDRALIAFADTCRAAVRSSDLVGRYGGEEFILLLVGAGSDRAGQVTEAINDALVRRAEVDDVILPTVSYGCTGVDRSLGLEQIIERADLALYRAKAQGRNRTVHYTQSLSS